MTFIHKLERMSRQMCCSRRVPCLHFCVSIDVGDHDRTNFGGQGDTEEETDEFKKLTLMLSNDIRARATDKTLSTEQLALESRKRLILLEKNRRARMQGLPVSELDESAALGLSKRAAQRRTETLEKEGIVSGKKKLGLYENETAENSGAKKVPRSGDALQANFLLDGVLQNEEEGGSEAGSDEEQDEVVRCLHIFVFSVDACICFVSVVDMYVSLFLLYSLRTLDRSVKPTRLKTPRWKNCLMSKKKVTQRRWIWNMIPIWMLPHRKSEQARKNPHPLLLLLLQNRRRCQQL